MSIKNKIVVFIVVVLFGAIVFFLLLNLFVPPVKASSQNIYGTTSTPGQVSITRVGHESVTIHSNGGGDNSVTVSSNCSPTPASTPQETPVPSASTPQPTPTPDTSGQNAIPTHASESGSGNSSSTSTAQAVVVPSGPPDTGKAAN